jgi:hypothetical protein
MPNDHCMSSVYGASEAKHAQKLARRIRHKPHRKRPALLVDRASHQLITEQREGVDLAIVWREESLASKDQGCWHGEA